MKLLDALRALETLVNFMALPAAIMAGAGAFMLYKGWQTTNENQTRAGKMLLMFGIILLAIVAILSIWFSGLPTDISR